MEIKKKIFLPLLFFDTVMIVLAIYLGVSTGKPLKFFDEGQFLTWISAFHLTATAVLSFMILLNSCQGQKKFSLGSPCAVWIYIAVGFVFLAGDELLQLH